MGTPPIVNESCNRCRTYPIKIPDNATYVISDIILSNIFVIPYASSGTIGAWNNPLCPNILQTNVGNIGMHLLIMELGLSISGRIDPSAHAQVKQTAFPGSGYIVIPAVIPTVIPAARCKVPFSSIPPF